MNNRFTPPLAELPHAVRVASEHTFETHDGAALFYRRWPAVAPVARGAIEDVASGLKTAVVARGESPVRLAVDLARAIVRLPGVAARTAVKGLIGRRGGGG